MANIKRISAAGAAIAIIVGGVAVGIEVDSSPTSKVHNENRLNGWSGDLRKLATEAHLSSKRDGCVECGKPRREACTSVSAIIPAAQVAAAELAWGEVFCIEGDTDCVTAQQGTFIIPHSMSGRTPITHYGMQGCFSGELLSALRHVIPSARFETLDDTRGRTNFKRVK